MNLLRSTLRGNSYVVDVVGEFEGNQLELSLFCTNGEWTLYHVKVLELDEFVSDWAEDMLRRNELSNELLRREREIVNYVTNHPNIRLKLALKR